MFDFNKLLIFWRVIFIGLLLLSGAFALQIGGQFNVDTDLADLAPKVNNGQGNEQAIAYLRSNIERRITFLIQSAEDEEAVYQGERYFRQQLSLMPDVRLLADKQTLGETLIHGLKPYRFSLLTKSQQQALKEKSAQQIAQQAKHHLFSSAGAQLLSFEDDPLGWHSQTFMDLLGSTQSGLSETQLDQGYATTVSAMIDRGALNMRAQELLNTQIQQLITHLHTEYNLSVAHSGVFFFASDAAASAKHDISLISIGSSAGVILLILVAFSSLRALLLPLASIFVGVVFASLITHTFYGRVHVLTIVFGASLIGIVIDYSLHYFCHNACHDERLNIEPAPSSIMTNNALQRALILSLLTSLIGYAALSFSSLHALKMLALFSCSGVLMAWLCVICLGPYAIRGGVKLNQSFLPNVVNRLVTLLGVFSNRVYLLVSLILLLAALGLIKFSSPFNDDPRAFFNASEALLNNERTVAEFSNDFEPGRFIVLNGRDNNQLYARYEVLLGRLKEHGIKASSITSLLDWIPSSEEQQHNYQQQATLYGTNGAAALLNLELNNSPRSSVNKDYSRSSKQTLTPLFVTQLLGDALPPMWFQQKEAILSFALIRKGVETQGFAQALQNLDGVSYINTLQQTQYALSLQRTGASKHLSIAYFLVALLILLRYRQLSALWLVAIPLCASAGVVLTTAAFGISLNLFHIMALFLVLGFGMDYSIFTKEMLKQSSHQRNLTLQAIVLSALTSILSFGLLTISSIPVVSSFGQTLLIGNIINLLGVFIANQIISSPANIQKL